jgi:hypothetical protein
MNKIKTINQNVAIIMTDAKNTNNVSNNEGIGLRLRYMVLSMPMMF